MKQKDSNVALFKISQRAREVFALKMQRLMKSSKDIWSLEWIFLRPAVVSSCLVVVGNVAVLLDAIVAFESNPWW